MLTALEQGVKGGKWFSLIDKVYRPANLQRAFARVKANKGAAGVDYQTIEMFEQHLETNLEHLASALKDGSYRPQALRREWIAKPGSSEKRRWASDGARPGGGNRNARSAGTNLRTRLC